MHRRNPELKKGSLKWLASDYNFMAYGRFTQSHHSVILINNNDHEIRKEVSVWELGIPKESCLKRLIFTHDRGFDTEAVEYEVKAGKINVTMPRTSAMVLQYVNEEEPSMERQKVRNNGIFKRLQY